MKEWSRILVLLAIVCIGLTACSPSPTVAPTIMPTVAPTIAPTAAPKPTEAPKATTAPTVAPTLAPTPTEAPKATAVPTVAPTEAPKATTAATIAPTVAPTGAGSNVPTKAAAAPATLAPVKATPTLLAKAPKNADELQIISPELLKAMLEGGADIVVIDVQPKSSYDMGHVKGAISLQWAMQIQEDDVSDIPYDKLLILYCDCSPDAKPSATDSGTMAMQFLRFGLTKVAVLDGGWSKWVQLGYPTAKGN